MENAVMKRSTAMDVIRCFALLTVICVHFFLRAGFYESYDVMGLRMYITVFLRSFFMICVPLFMVLSGYLLNNKTPSKKYYSKLFYTLGIYLLACIACIVYIYIRYPENFPFTEAIFRIFDFSAVSYAWYIEMYIGLFLLIPFLNILYHNIKTQKQKQLLILTMLILTAIPQVINSFRFFDLNWWIQPSSSNIYNIIFPDWWVGIYPITYYFIGCYLKEYPIKIKSSANALLILLAFIVIGAYGCYRAYGDVLRDSNRISYGSILNVIPAVLVFNFFANLKYKWVNEGIGKILAYLSKLTLGAYLCSWIFDDIFYSMLRNYVSDIPLRLNYMPIIVPAVFVCSLALSGILNWIYNIIAKPCKSLFKKREKTA